jgi:hypothetical protein
MTLLSEPLPERPAVVLLWGRSLIFLVFAPDERGGHDDLCCSGRLSWRRRWRAPWGLLPAGPTAVTTGVGDVDGGPPCIHGHLKQVRQKRDVGSKMTLGGLARAPAA